MQVTAAWVFVLSVAACSSDDASFVSGDASIASMPSTAPASVEQMTSLPQTSDPLVNMSAESVPMDIGATLTVRIENETDRDVEYKKNGYVQRRDGDAWVNVLLAPFGRADQPGQPCTTDVACDVTPDAPILRSGEVRSYVIALPELDAGEYRLSMRPTYPIDSNSWTV